jgi:hypothetical protein
MGGIVSGWFPLPPLRDRAGSQVAMCSGVGGAASPSHSTPQPPNSLKPNVAPRQICAETPSPMEGPGLAGGVGCGRGAGSCGRVCVAREICVQTRKAVTRKVFTSAGRRDEVRRPDAWAVEVGGDDGEGRRRAGRQWPYWPYRLGEPRGRGQMAGAEATIPTILTIVPRRGLGVWSAWRGQTRPYRP